MPNPKFKDPRLNLMSDEEVYGPPVAAQALPEEFREERQAISETLPQLSLSQEPALEATPYRAGKKLSEQALQDTPSLEIGTESQPELTAQDRYKMALQAAATAGPSEADYRTAAMRRVLAESRAATPGYLEQMSKTLFHKPDFSAQAAAAKARLERPQYEIQGKKAEQERLADIAEGVRKEAMLPAEMAEKEAKSLQTKAKLEELKPAGAEAIAEAERRFGIKINPNATKAELAKIMDTATTTEIKERGVPLTDVRRKVLEKQLSAAAGQEINLEGLTENDAKLLVNAFKQGKDKGISEYQRVSLALRERGLDIAQDKLAQVGERRKVLEGKEVSGVINGIRKDYVSDTKKSEEKLTDLDKLILNARSKNWQAFNNVAATMAKAVGGDSGALSDKDIARYSDSPEMAQRIKDDISKFFTGVPTEETREGYVKVAQDVKMLIERKLADKQEQYKKRLMGNRVFKSADGTEEEANEQLFGGKIYGKPSTPSQQTPATPAAGFKNEREELEFLEKKFKNRPAPGGK